MNPLPNPCADTLDRRRFLWESGAGLGSVALAWLMQQESRAAEATSPYAPKPSHFPAKAKRVIHICALGGVSHVDTFDFKPELEKRDGQESGKVFDSFFGQPGRLMKSRFAFRQHGQSGRWLSELLPHLAGCVDDLTFIHSMHSKSANHTPATFLMNSGFTLNGFPSVGSWISYGLGSENQNLPAFVVLPDVRQTPSGGPINWSAGFLPAVHQGVAFTSRGPNPIPDLRTPMETSAESRRASIDLLAKLNQRHQASDPSDNALAARIRAYELAAQMQISVPEAVGIDGESEATKKLYGLDDAASASFGRNCLLARRLIERGTRFVQLFNGGQFGQPRINWDGHEDVRKNHLDQAATMDKPLAGLLKDLKDRGLLKDTVVLWTTEFGRTPITQGIGGQGRDHHQKAFTIFAAGAGLRAGTAFGATDDIGFEVADKPVEFYDIHATLLHLLGIDHERLTYYHNGVNRRLTDVHGQVIKEVLS